MQMFTSVQPVKCEMATTITERKCNILLLGMSGAGKSTVANHIVGQMIFSVGGSSRTSQICRVIRSLSTIKYHFKIIEISHPELTNQEVIECINTSLKCQLPEGVHLILFVLQVGQLRPEEHTTFRYIMDSFKGQDISDISAVVITHCEGKSAWARKRIVSEFIEQGLTKDIVKSKRVVCVGFPHLYEVDELLMEGYQRSIQRDTEQLHALIKESNNIKDIKFQTVQTVQRQCTIM